MNVPAILYSQMEPPDGMDAAFNEWYDEEHVPSRLDVEGFTSAVRYRKHTDDPNPSETPGYAVTYFVRNLDVFQTSAYRELKRMPSERTRQMLSLVQKFTRYTGIQVQHTVKPGVPALQSLPVLFVVLFNVPEERQAEFEAWYDEDHVPLLLQEPLWCACDRYRLHESEPGQWTHLTLHYLGSSEALQSPYRAEARQTPWRKRLAQEPWFKGSYSLYERISPPARWSANDQKAPISRTIADE